MYLGTVLGSRGLIRFLLTASLINLDTAPDDVFLTPNVPSRKHLLAVLLVLVLDKHEDNMYLFRIY